MSVIRSDNERLKEQIEALREAREAKERKCKEVEEPPRRAIKKDKHSVLGTDNRGFKYFVVQKEIYL